MTTEYFDAANSLCSDSFESIKRSRLISDDYKNSDFDCENQMDYSGDHFQSEVSAKASSSSIHESITNMSNSHSTPEDTFSEITLSSPSSKHCKPDSDIKDYEQSTDQYLSTSNIHCGINQTSNELVKPLPTASNNLKSIDDTIELVLSKIREENNFSKNYDLSESCFNEKSDTSNFLHSNEISNCASNSNNVQTNNMISVSRGVSSLGSDSHDSDNLSYSKGITTSGSCHNSNIVNYGIPNYNKSYPQQFYKYNNYGIPPQMAAANFPNQINAPNYPEFNKIDYSRSNYSKEYDKNKYNYYPYQCQNPQFRQYLPNSYLSQPSFYKPDSPALSIHNPNYQMLQKSLKRNAYFNQMYIEDDINHLYKDNSKTQNYNTYFKTPQSNTGTGIDQNNSIRKKRTNTDTAKLTPSKKRKVANQLPVANNVDELMKKLKVSTYNSLLMNPPVSQSVIVLSPKGFVDSSTKSICLQKSLQYKKYRSTLFQIQKPKLFSDFTEEDRYLSRYIDENMTGNSILSQKKNLESDDFSDIISSSPPSNHTLLPETIEPITLHHLSIDDIDSDPRSPELINSASNHHKPIDQMTITKPTNEIPPKLTLTVVNGLKNHFMTPIVSYSDSETKLITELHSLKSQELNRNYIQLSGSFLKRTKINGKSFSNIHIEEAVSVASLSASKNQNSCQFCYVFLNGLSAIRKSSKLFGIDSNDDLVFCSTSCYSNFKSCNSFDCNPDCKKSLSHNNSNNNNQINNSTNNLQCTKVLIKTTPYKPAKNYKKVCDFEQYVRRRFPSEGQSDNNNPTNGISKLPPPSLATDATKKRLLGVNYSYYENDSLPTIYKEIEKNDQHVLLKRYSCSYRGTDLVDHRSCVLCHSVGDGDEDVCGRLMNIDADNWAHLNCALWCFEVYETVSGSLMEVQSSLQRAVKTVCTFCHTTGAGIQCYRSKCSAVYHVPCAHKVGCIFYTDRGMYCPNHVVLNHPMHLPSLRVERRVNIHRDESALIAGIVAEDQDIRMKFRTGSLILNNIGQLLPEQLLSGRYNSSSIIYPVGYHATRIYWSSTRGNRRCKYECFIDEHDDMPLFKVSFTDSGGGGSGGSGGGCGGDDDDDSSVSGCEHVFTDRCCDKLWKTILHKIAQFRHDCGLTRLFPRYLSGEQLYGLMEPQIIRVIESLPGVELIKNYAFKFGKMQLITEMPLAINPTGAARTEPKLRTYVRRGRNYSATTNSNNNDEDNNNNNSDNHNNNRSNSKCSILKAKSTINNNNQYQNNYNNSSNNNNNNNNNTNNNVTTYAYELTNHHHPSNKAAIINSKTQQYKRLKLEWMNNVVLSRSKIQGLGLFAAKDFDKSTMIIEYIGEIIRNEVGNRREKRYQARNNSIYMFRLNEDVIIDATVNGGLARYINHSCNPNCVAETLSLDCGSRIIITTRQVIERGEELTYDYKFDFEDNTADRIPCLCGAINCRKWMN